MKTISKELLSEVLELHISKIKEVNKLNAIVEVIDTIGMHSNINIYELAHKCKEWAYIHKGYIIRSSIGTFSVANINGIGENFIADSEPEAVFKACEWILNENKK